MPRRREVPKREILPDPKFGNVESVSYTHLRAHETVLDLVCRLLLEKKKKPSNYNRSIVVN